MAGNPPPTAAAANNLYAAIDMGTNSFKLLIIHSTATSRFFPLLRIKYPVVLPSPTSPTISPSAELRAISALRHFHSLLASHGVPLSHTRHVATSALRHAPNQTQLLRSLYQALGPGFQIDVLSGEDEARLTYRGVLQFHPIYDKKALIVDIGGGSTEFVLGKHGEVMCGVSVQLGHVTLTQEFMGRGGIDEMREHIRNVIRQSGLVEELDKHGFEVVIGSSGTIRAIEKAIYNGYGKDLNLINDLNLFKGYKRDWKFSRGNLSDLVERLCLEEETEWKVERETVFKKRSEFIVAGAVLLEEIFDMLRIKEMEVSCHSLREGVIAEKFDGSFEEYHLNANARWCSVIGLASRFNSKKKLRSSTLCAAIARETFESVRKWNEVSDGGHRLGVSLDDNDLEYLEAACLLHSIGVITGKKGYHKQSYHIIMNGGHLHGYDLQEIKIIALLSRHHRKKFPKLDRQSLNEFTIEVKQKFRILCAILRVSIVIQQCIPVNIQEIKVSHSQEGFKLVLGELSDQPIVHGKAHTLPEDADRELAKELEIFSAVLHQKLTVLVPSCSLESSKERALVEDTMTPQL